MLFWIAGKILKRRRKDLRISKIITFGEIIFNANSYLAKSLKIAIIILEGENGA